MGAGEREQRDTRMSKKRIIIVGGGFAGVKCAQELARKLKAEEAEIVLFNSENHLVFSPLLAEVVGSSVSPMDVIVPLRQMLPRAFCRTEEVQGVNLEKNEVEYQSEQGETKQMAYDHLVLACGNVTNLNAVPGMADHAFALKTVGDAANLRSHIMEQMEKAEVAEKQERRCWHLSFVIVGGGFSGAEAAGEINDLVRSSTKYFKSFKREDVSVTLIHSRDQILPEISPGLREFAKRKMEKAGVNIIMNARVISATPEGVTLDDGKIIKGGTVVCTVGNSPAPLLARINVAKEKWRLVTEGDMRLKGSKNVWAVRGLRIHHQLAGQPTGSDDGAICGTGREAMCGKYRPRAAQRANEAILLQTTGGTLFDRRAFGGGGFVWNAFVGIFCMVCLAGSLLIQAADVWPAITGGL